PFREVLGRVVEAVMAFVGGVARGQAGGFAPGGLPREGIGAGAGLGAPRGEPPPGAGGTGGRGQSRKTLFKGVNGDEAGPRAGPAFRPTQVREISGPERSTVRNPG